MRRICTSTCQLVLELRATLEEAAPPKPPSPSRLQELRNERRREPPDGSVASGVSTAVSTALSSAGRSEVDLSELQGECERLSSRAQTLEGSAGRAADLERVAEKLRSRVRELEGQESRIEGLRKECSSLRSRIAELVTTAVETEEEHKALLSQVHYLEEEPTIEAPFRHGVYMSPHASPSPAGWQG